MKWGEYIVRFTKENRLISFYTGTQEDCEMYALGAKDVLKAFYGEGAKGRRLFKVELTKTNMKIGE